MHKKILSVFLSTVVLVTSVFTGGTSFAAVPTSIISDGGFDTATVGKLTNAYDSSTNHHLAIINNPGTWYNFSTWILPGAIVESEGNKYINCTPANTSYFKYVGTTVNIEKNTDYVLMFNAKTNRTGVKGYVASALKTSSEHSTIDTSLANTAIDNGENWQTYSIAFSSGELTQVVLAFGLEVSTAAATDYYAIDDVKLYKKSDLIEVTTKADGPGTVEASMDYVISGEEVTLTARADTDAQFKGWYKGETKVSDEPIFKITPDSSATYTARFFGNLVGSGNFDLLTSATLNTTVFGTNEGKWGIYGKSGWTWMTPSKIVEAEGNKYLQSSKSGNYMNYTGIILNNLASNTEYVVKFKAKNAISYADIYAKVVEESSVWNTTNDAFGNTSGSGTAYTALGGAQVKLNKTDDWAEYSFAFTTGTKKVALIFGAYTGSASTDEAYCIDDVQVYKKADLVSIIAKADGPGSASVSSSYVISGEDVTLTAAPKNGAKFLGWYKGDTKVSDKTEYTISATESAEYTAKFFGNLVYDGSFEDMPVGKITTRVGADGSGTTENYVWGYYNSWVQTPEIVSDTATAQHGSKYMKATAADGFMRAMGMLVPVEKNTSYVFSFWAKNDITYAPIYAGVVKNNEAWPQTTIESTARAVISGGEWKKYTITFNSGEHTQLGLVFGGYVATENTTDSYFVDNVTLYKKADLVEVSVKVDGPGTVEGAPTYAVSGEQVTLTAKANENCKFSGFYKGDVLVSKNTEFTVTVTESVTYTAKFFGNAIADGSFEKFTDGTVSAANPVTSTNVWGVYGTANGWLSIATVVNNSAEAKDGNKYLKVAGSGSYMRYMGVSVSVTKNTDYVLSFWAKSNIDYGNVIARVIGNTEGWAMTAIEQTATTTVSSSDEWRQYTVEFNSGDYDKVSLVFGLSKDTKDTALSYCLDDITLYKKADLVEVTAKADGPGTVEVAPDYTVPGGSVTLIATPNIDCQFIGWYKGDELISEEAICTVSVTKATEYTAKFVGSFIINGYFEQEITTDFRQVDNYKAYQLNKSNPNQWIKLLTGKVNPELVADPDDNASGNTVMKNGIVEEKYLKTVGQIIELDAGEYILSFRAKNSIQAANVHYYFGVYNGDSFDQANSSDTFIDKDNKWKTYTKKLKVEKDNSLVVVSFGNNTDKIKDETGCYYIDDVEVYKTSDLYNVSTKVDDSVREYGMVSQSSEIFKPAEVVAGEAKVTLTAKPLVDSKFVGWYKNGVKISDKATYEYTISVTDERNMTFVAKFDPTKTNLIGDDVVTYPYDNGTFEIYDEENFKDYLPTQSSSHMVLLEDDKNAAYIPKLTADEVENTLEAYQNNAEYYGKWISKEGSKYAFLAGDSTKEAASKKGFTEMSQVKLNPLKDGNNISDKVLLLSCPYRSYIRMLSGLKTDATYRITFQYYAPNINTGATVGISTSIGGTLAENASTLVKTSSGWVTATFTYTHREIDSRAYLVFKTEPSDGLLYESKTYYIDNLSVTKEAVYPVITNTSAKNSYCPHLYNKVENSDFENSLTTNDWLGYIPADRIRTGGAASGENYMRLAKGDSFAVPVTLEAAREYVFALSTRTSNGGKGTITLALDEKGKNVLATLDKTFKSVLTATSTEWQRMGFEFNPAENTTVYLIFNCSDGTMDIDAVSIFNLSYGYADDINNRKWYQDFDYQAFLTQDDESTTDIIDSPATGDKSLAVVALLISIMASLVAVMCLFGRKEQM